MPRERLRCMPLRARRQTVAGPSDHRRQPYPEKRRRLYPAASCRRKWRSYLVLPAKLLTEPLLSLTSNSGYSVFHVAAAYGHLDQIPISLLTPAVVVSKIHLGNTLLHEAAEHGALDRFPKRYFTLHNFLQRNFGGETVFHVAGFNGHLGQVPPALLFEGDLSAKNPFGRKTVACGFCRRLRPP